MTTICSRWPHAQHSTAGGSTLRMAQEGRPRPVSLSRPQFSTPPPLRPTSQDAGCSVQVPGPRARVHPGEHTLPSSRRGPNPRPRPPPRPSSLWSGLMAAAAGLRSSPGRPHHVIGPMPRPAWLSRPYPASPLLPHSLWAPGAPLAPFQRAPSPASLVLTPPRLPAARAPAALPSLPAGLAPGDPRLCGVLRTRPRQVAGPLLRGLRPLLPEG